MRGADTVGARAISNIKSGSGTLQICVDFGELKRIGESNKIKAGTSWTADLSLGPGVYTLYSVANQNNQSSEKSGNLKEYFAKATLKIQ